MIFVLHDQQSKRHIHEIGIIQVERAKNLRRLDSQLEVSKI